MEASAAAPGASRQIVLWVAILPLVLAVGLIISSDPWDPAGVRGFVRLMDTPVHSITSQRLRGPHPNTQFGRHPNPGLWAVGPGKIKHPGAASQQSHTAPLNTTDATEWVPAVSLMLLLCVTGALVASVNRGIPDPLAMMLLTPVDEAEEGSTAMPDDHDTAFVDVTPKKDLVAMHFFLLIPLLVSAFILQAHFYGTPLAQFLPRQMWKWIHLMGAMLFGGLVVSSTLYEGLVILYGDPAVLKWWFERVPVVDARIMLPFLGVTVVSGVCLAQTTFGGFANSPPFVALTLEILTVFGAVWGVLDKRTQGPAKQRCVEDFEAIQRGTYQPPVALPPVMRNRLIINACSSVFIPILYWCMVMKPSFDLLWWVR